MATDEAGFKQELKESVRSTFQNQFVWCPMDKIQSGVTDLHVIIDKFYGIEAKFCKTLPKRDSSNILSHAFSDKQVRFMTQLNNTGAAFGVGVIWLGPSSAVMVHPSQLDEAGNISRHKIQNLYRECSQEITKVGKFWDVQRLVEFSKKWVTHG